MVDKSIDLTLINKLSYDLILKHLCQNEVSVLHQKKYTDKINFYVTVMFF